MSIVQEAYKKDRGRLCGPVYFAQEEYSFYLNMNTKTSDPDFANFRLDLRLMGDTVAAVQDIGQLLQDIDSLGFYNIYSSFAFPQVLPGWYEYVIYDYVNDIVKAVSNPLLVQEELLTENTAIFSYRDSSNKYGVNFEGMPDFWLRVRLPIIQIDWQPDTERKQYRNVTNRRLRNLRNYKDETVKLQGYKLTEDMHRALSCIFDHDQVFVNDSFIVAKGVYTVQTNDRSIFSNGSIDVVVDETVALPESLISQVSEFDPVDWSDEFD